VSTSSNQNGGQRPSIADHLKQTRELAVPEKPLLSALDKFRPQLARALPATMTVDRFLSTVHGAVGKNPQIADCEPMSILQSVGQAARLGLLIDTAGHGFLVPYYDTKRKVRICQFIPGWQGIVDLINRSGRGVVTTGAVFPGDFFEYQLGSDPYLKHRNEGEEDALQLIGTYCIGTIKGEGGWTPPPIIEFWPARKIRKHLDTYNKVGEGHYALKNDNNWVMYSRKVPLLQVAKYMPKSSEIAAAIAAASRAETGESMTLDGDFVFPLGDGGGGDGGHGGDAGAGDPPRPAYADLVERLKTAKNRDGADLILDQARHLPADQQKDLAKFADDKFPRA